MAGWDLTVLAAALSLISGVVWASASLAWAKLRSVKEI